MELNEIMNQIKGTSNDGLQKVASAPAANKTGEARGKLLNALSDVLAPAKTASARSTSQPAIGELVKMASSVVAAEDSALQKEATLYGAAVADGFMARLHQYSDVAPVQKTASADGVPTQAEFEKFASANPDLTKQAIDLGYLHGKQQIEQLKVAAFDQGYADTMAQIGELNQTAAGQAELRKVAAAVNSQNDLGTQLEKLAETPEGREKLAEIKHGYDDTMNELTKMAGDTFDRGYNDTIRVLQAM